MSHQQPAYGQYPAPPVQYAYPPNPYSQAQQPPYAYSQAPPTQAHNQFFANLQHQSPAQQQQQQQQHQPPPSQHQQLQHQQQQPQHAHPERSATGGPQPIPTSAAPTEPNGPGAPPPEPSSDGESNYAEQLISALRRNDDDGVPPPDNDPSNEGTPTSQVLQFLQKTNPNGLFTRTDVANLKLKYKKFGTCVDRRDGATQDKQMGVPSACKNCRAKKMKCSSERPVCTECRDGGKECSYDHEADGANITWVQPNSVTIAGSADTNISTDLTQQPQPPQQRPARGRGRPSTSAVGTDMPSNAEARAILANLQNFTQAHVRPARLDLNSSSVEVLARSSCGEGESYKMIAPLKHTSEWPAYSAAFLEASMKENTHEILVGLKSEPVSPAAPGAKEEDSEVEIWNEYIKQLAIYHRRNSALLWAIRSTLSPAFKQRITHIDKASHVWAVIEDACAPRGSSDGFRLFLELHQISLASSHGLNDYITQLERKYNQINALAAESRSKNPAANASQPTFNGRTNSASNSARSVSHRSGYSSGAVNPWSTLHPSLGSAGEHIVTEDSLCFLFLKSLGSGWEQWVQNICSTTNLGGFGTGPRLAWNDLVKRAREWDAMNGRGGS
ncbi:hypothetical protein K431DRAFT_82031 [Polychaeton citri CBS 116435]|uniref:Zn(2)-C6 fungal-type domain-containing protein n=1 Tax=Polychaeton citri CBS 116435 TaxID=1314669 RepID=A0A9P4QIT8_9PEZI|nr:hypothetical protein K431DRAFT_82031 [Polychaeton citri CBS 116435]